MDHRNDFQKSSSERTGEDLEKYPIDDSKFTGVYANALASNQSIYDFIDNIYEINKYYYYNWQRSPNGITVSA